MAATTAASSSVHEAQDASGRHCGTALLIIDMVGTWDFPGGAQALRAAAGIAPVIARLAGRCRKAGLPVIYANDNHGRWRSDWRRMMDDALAAGGQGACIARMLAPQDDDYFVLKPMHSAFFATPLHLLLTSLRTHRLLLTGTTSDQCVLATASDARMLGYEAQVPRDAVASMTAARSRAALRHFGDVLRVRTTPAARVRLA